MTLQGSQIVPSFVITGDKPAAFSLNAPGQPKNDDQEVFVVDGANLLQLTNFQRVDTVGPIVGVDRQTVFFIASADPLGRIRPRTVRSSRSTGSAATCVSSPSSAQEAGSTVGTLGTDVISKSSAWMRRVKISRKIPQRGR